MSEWDRKEDKENQHGERNAEEVSSSCLVDIESTSGHSDNSDNMEKKIGNEQVLKVGAGRN